MRDNPLAGLRVLIVEDDTLIALDLGGMLSASGAEIIGPVHSASSALTLIDQQRPDIAVLDWQLLHETASPVAARLSSLGMPFLFHTSQRELPEAAYPGVTIVDKPATPDQLVLAMSALKGKA